VIDPFLKIGPHVSALPVVNGSGDFAWEVRRLMTQHDFDCLAVPLPSSFQAPVESAILQFPTPSIVVQRDRQTVQQWTPAAERSNEKDDEELLEGASYVPIDPCQGMIAALRTAMGERMPRRFIDLETSRYEPHTAVMPDAYALKKLPIQKFAAAVAPHLVPGDSQQWRDRIAYQAAQLRELSIDYKRILFVVSILDWPYVRKAFNDRELQQPEHESVEDPQWYQLDPETLFFLLGELPFVTDLYEKARRELGEDEYLAIDGIKELLISSRTVYQQEFKSRARKITPNLLAKCLQYLRNLTLIEHRFSPQLIDIVISAQQVAGDGYARHVLEQAKNYSGWQELGQPECRLGIDRVGLPDGEMLSLVNRLPGPPVTWRQLEIQPKPPEKSKKDWNQRWNPFSQCSWPPEDDLIESFRRAVFNRAKEAMGADLAKTEKFTTSVKDGIDIRETVRHWYDGEIYVKVLPPNKGRLDVAVMMFDSPADPREYPWRTTWFAEHAEESTLAFFASDFREQPVGPGICLAHYGGAMFIYPPVPIPDIWQDPRLDFATTLEERLLAAACLHAECKHVALLSSAPPGQAWKQIAKRFKKVLVHLPLSSFADSSVQQLRMVHVLNGKEVRSYAAEFIRRA
jgi:hypothetical protein